MSFCHNGAGMRYTGRLPGSMTPHHLRAQLTTTRNVCSCSQLWCFHFKEEGGAKTQNIKQNKYSVNFSEINLKQGKICLIRVKWHHLCEVLKYCLDSCKTKLLTHEKQRSAEI